MSIRLTNCLFQGVFAFKRPKTKKNEDSPEATSLNYWTQGDNEDVKLLTYKSYVSCWQKVNKLILVRHYSESMFSCLCYVNKYHSNRVDISIVNLNL